MPHQPKILIIDDDPDQVEALQVTLEPEGYQILSASSGQEGLQKALDEKPDLIILDIMMTDETEGIRVAHQLRSPVAPPAYAALRNVPILALSAIHQKTRLRFNNVAGTDMLPVNDWIDKPVEPQQLLAKIRQLLSGKPQT